MSNLQRGDNLGFALIAAIERSPTSLDTGRESFRITKM
jgi:hypothetical protein